MIAEVTTKYLLNHLFFNSLLIYLRKSEKKKSQNETIKEVEVSSFYSLTKKDNMKACFVARIDDLLTAVDGTNKTCLCLM